MFYVWLLGKRGENETGQVIRILVRDTGKFVLGQILSRLIFLPFPCMSRGMFFCLVTGKMPER